MRAVLPAAALLVLLLAAPAVAHTTGDHANLSDHPENAPGENATDGFASLYGAEDPVLLGLVLVWLGFVMNLTALALHLHGRERPSPD